MTTSQTLKHPSQQCVAYTVFKRPILTFAFYSQLNCSTFRLPNLFGGKEGRKDESCFIYLFSFCIAEFKFRFGCWAMIARKHDWKLLNWKKVSTRHSEIELLPRGSLFTFIFSLSPPRRQIEIWNKLVFLKSACCRHQSRQIPFLSFNKGHLFCFFGFYF